MEAREARQQLVQHVKDDIRWVCTAVMYFRVPHKGKTTYCSCKVEFSGHVATTAPSTVPPALGSLQIHMAHKGTASQPMLTPLPLLQAGAVALVGAAAGAESSTKGQFSYIAASQQA